MTRIQAHFRVVTPLFLAGYDQSTAELRVPSIKGVLRFWWRALEGMHSENLGSLRTSESELFGSTSNQSSVLMRVEKVGEWPEPQTGKKYESSAVLKELEGDSSNIGARYLAYGVVEAFGSKTGRKAGQLQRGVLSHGLGLEFKLHLLLQKSTHLPSLLGALKLMGLLGSLGSKSRKGYGSLCLTELRVEGSNETWTAPKTVEELKDELAKLWRYALDGQSRSRNAPEPQFTQLSPLSQILLLQSTKARDPIDLLDKLGREMVRYRSWGKGGKILGNQINSEKNFRHDHDLFKNPHGEIKSHPKRLVFGLPHNYAKGQNVEGVGENGQRRASPLFIHIHQPSPQVNPIAVVAFLPAVFLANPKVSVFRQTVALEPSPQLWQPIIDFLTRLKGTHQAPPLQREESFDSVVEVL